MTRPFDCILLWNAGRPWIHVKTKIKKINQQCSMHASIMDGTSLFTLSDLITSFWQSLMDVKPSPSSLDELFYEK